MPDVEIRGLRENAGAWVGGAKSRNEKWVGVSTFRWPGGMRYLGLGITSSFISIATLDKFSPPLPMATPEKPRSPRRFVAQVAVTLAALLGLYFLSFGPVLYYTHDRLLPNDQRALIAPLYQPLLQSRNYAPSFYTGVLQPYALWWTNFAAKHKEPRQ
jgi:hypothetical protein